MGSQAFLESPTLHHISNNKYVYKLKYSANILDIHNRRYILHHIVFNCIVLDADARKKKDDIEYCLLASRSWWLLLARSTTFLENCFF